MLGIIFKIFVPSGLALMMVGMGLQLEKEDWLRVLKYPRAVWVGMVGQFIVLPMIALILITLVPLPLAISAGLIIVASCPGGIISNSVSFLARGDIPLSVTLTAISSILGLVTIPIFLSIGLSLVQTGLVDADIVKLPVGKTIKQLFLVVFLPLMLGMTIRHFARDFAERSDRWVRVGGVIVLLVLLFGAIAMQFDFFLQNFMSLWPILFALNIGALIAGYLLARIAKLNDSQSVTIAIEVGVQNVALGAMLALTILQQPEWLVVPSIYSVVMTVTAFTLIGALGFHRKKTAS